MYNVWIVCDSILLFMYVSVGSCTLVGASGEYSDFQSIIKMMEENHQYDLNVEDGFEMSPCEYFNLLRAVMYNRR